MNMSLLIPVSIALAILFSPVKYQLSTIGEETLALFCKETCIGEGCKGTVLMDYVTSNNGTTLYISYIPKIIAPKTRFSFGVCRVAFQGNDNIFFKYKSGKRKKYSDVSRTGSSPFDYIDDYPILTIPFFLDGKVNPYLVSWNTQQKSVDPFLSLFKEHEVVSHDEEWAGNHIFTNMEMVDSPPAFPGGINGYRELIKQYFRENARIDRDVLENMGRVLAVASLIVDEHGSASVGRFIRSSGNQDIDSLIMEACEVLCTARLTPAIHRGKAVKCEFPVYFLSSDLIDAYDADLSGHCAP